jgi:hypothetical protein
MAVRASRDMSSQVLLLELNELNFEHLRFYARRGETPNLAKLMETNGVSTTISEQRCEELEPWIQWVTAHTGLPYADHGVFRLGDIVQHDILQIWERLEDHGLRVGAISPMNAKNRMRDPAFFVPDPWTPTVPTARPLLRKLHQAVSQAVNDNAQSRTTSMTRLWLAAGLLRYAGRANYSTYIALARSKNPWSKAMFLDLLLADVFIAETKATKPHFASLFVNAAAHIQHHYMFNAASYAGTERNPDWYVAGDQDPVGEVYLLYDRIVGQVLESFPKARLMIATGLHQDPHGHTTYYWRLKDHEAFLKKIGVPFERVEPRMSRDFIVGCAGTQQAAEAERILCSAQAGNGEPLFEVDNRGRDLFVMLTWPHDIPAALEYAVCGARYTRLDDDVAFVAIKNGRHNGIGYFIDSGANAQEVAPASFPLRDIPLRVCAALGVSWEAVELGNW